MPHLAAAAESARTYALIGFIFYVLSAIGWVIGVMVSAVFIVPATAMGFTTMFFPLFFPFGVFAAISVGFAWWSWTTMQQIEQGRYADARTPSLVLGILGLFFAWLIGGIFFLLAYGKLGEIVMPAYVPAPPPTQRFCVQCGRAVHPQSKFCGNCGKELPA